MPSEAPQSDANLEQPWKKWYSKLKPMSRPDVRDGTLILENNGDNNSGNQGTTALDKRRVDFAATKEKPTLKACQA